MLPALRLVDFRCFPERGFEAPAAGLLLTGSNARGKTSVLEAICVLVRLHSPRTHRMGSMARMGASGGFGIAGSPWGVERRVRFSREGLSLEVGGDAVAGRGAYLEEGGLVVWMGNEDLELVRGPGELRRRYLDFIGAQLDPAYRRSLARYRRALHAKNLLLRDGAGRERELRAYEEVMAEHGAVLMQIRARVVEGLHPLSAAAQRTISGRDEVLTLRYLASAGTDLAEAMRQARVREVRVRQSVVGPHRDDLELRLQGLPAGEFASEGQQRTLAIALKLAQGALLADACGRMPLYLIDDVFGELDPARRNALMASLPGAAQKWITTTHLDWMREVPQVGDFARLRLDE